MINFGTSVNSTFFVLNGLERPKGGYEPIYHNKCSGCDVEIGIRNVYTGEVLQEPVKIFNWKNITDNKTYTVLQELLADLDDIISFKKGNGGGVGADKHIKDYPQNTSDFEDRNFYFKNSYESEVLPYGIYAYPDSFHKQRIIQDLGLKTIIFNSKDNFSDIYIDSGDSFITRGVSSVTEDSFIINFKRKVQGKTITILINPLDKTLILDEIPANQLTDLKPNEWNIIYVHYLGNFQKSDLDLGSSGTVNLYNVQIKQPIIV